MSVYALERRNLISSDQNINEVSFTNRAAPTAPRYCDMRSAARTVNYVAKSGFFDGAEILWWGERMLDLIPCGVRGEKFISRQ